MFFFRKLFGLFFLTLLILGVIGLFSRSGPDQYQAAYQEGFIAGQQAAVNSGQAAPAGVEESTTVAPTGQPGTQIFYRGHGFFFPGFGLLLCLMPLFFFGLLFMVFGKRRRYGRHGHWGHYRRGYGPCGPGPWGRRENWDDSPKEKSPEDIDDGSDEPIRHA